MKTNAPYRGKNWSKLSLSIKERDGFICQQCGFVGNRSTLDCHHIIPYRLFKTSRDAHAKANLTTLCKPCHSKADNEFWTAHPELFSSKRLPYPDVPPRPCRKCGTIIDNPSPHQSVCKPCTRYTCDVCGKPFTRRPKGDRVPRFCSRECNIAFRKASAIWPRKCLDCGKSIQGGRRYCWDCWVKDPVGRVRPGRKAGRRPKVQPSAAISED